jgi:hypothetical protein
MAYANAGTALVLLEQIGEASGMSIIKGVAGVGALIMELCDVSFFTPYPLFTTVQGCCVSLLLRTRNHGSPFKAMLLI